MTFSVKGSSCEKQVYDASKRRVFGRRYKRKKETKVGYSALNSRHSCVAVVKVQAQRLVSLSADLSQLDKSMESYHNSMGAEGRDQQSAIFGKDRQACKGEM